MISNNNDITILKSLLYKILIFILLNPPFYVSLFAALELLPYADKS